jgi:hypothetical protein
MEFEHQKERFLKLKEGYRRKVELIHELEELERNPDLESVMERKRKLDHELDAIEDIELEDLIRFQALFVEEVAQSRPDLLPPLESLIKNCIETGEEHRQIRIWIEFYEVLLPHLAQILYLRRSSSGFGMIKYLFGQRPTNLITDEINKIKQLLTKQAKEYDNPLFAKLFDLTRQRWDFRRIDHEYAPLFSKFEHQYTQLLDVEKKALQAHQDAENDLSFWIENIQ